MWRMSAHARRKRNGKNLPLGLRLFSLSSFTFWDTALPVGEPKGIIVWVVHTMLVSSFC